MKHAQLRRGGTVLLAAALTGLLGTGCQPVPVEGTVVDKNAYPRDRSARCLGPDAEHSTCVPGHEPTRYYVSVADDDDPDAPWQNVQVDAYTYLDLQIGEHFDEREHAMGVR